MTLQPRPASEAASCDPYAVTARGPGRPIVSVGWPIYRVWAAPMGAAQ